MRNTILIMTLLLATALVLTGCSEYSDDDYALLEAKYERQMAADKAALNNLGDIVEDSVEQSLGREVTLPEKNMLQRTFSNVKESYKSMGSSLIKKYQVRKAKKAEAKKIKEAEAAYLVEHAEATSEAIAKGEPTVTPKRKEITRKEKVMQPIVVKPTPPPVKNLSPAQIAAAERIAKLKAKHNRQRGQ